MPPLAGIGVGLPMMWSVVWWGMAILGVNLEITGHNGHGELDMVVW